MREELARRAQPGVGRRHQPGAAVNLVTALDASLGRLVAEGMPARVARHEKMARALRAGLGALRWLRAQHPDQLGTA